MKKILFMLLLPVMANCQITGVAEVNKVTIGQVKRGPVFWASLSYMINQNQDTSYVFIYRASNYTKFDVYRQINFSGGTKTLRQFYDLLKSMFLLENKDKPDYYVNFTLGEVNTTLKIKKNLFATQLYLLDNRYTESYAILTNNEIDDLFYSMLNKPVKMAD